ncbi:hypothetical protein [Vannielia litorea]|uniref:hypothetical protein n=1 Tax=Vannielia litorea TaxID=1217970 RepID=UPI001C98879F|nr:hypothetical protein [Vannielia litorea]MBY6046939.1 hypothetical protein [Vannielia litorea]MBY6074353.1 hypothetical protein [Vannielia litorea]
MVQIRAGGIAVDFAPKLGLIEALRVQDGGQEVAPFHRAPWVGREAMPEGAPPHLARLGGDFFCAPFGQAGGGVPLHGWPCNSPWDVEARAGELRAVLRHEVQGARLTKRLALRDGEPFIYQSHVFEGGAGAMPVANHANIALPEGGYIRTSAKRRWQTGGTALEPDPARGRSALAYPARATDAGAFPGAAGPVDLGRYPWGDRHEDFVAGIEAEDSSLGWTAVTRPAEGDLYLSLRNPRALPMTMLWHSNGGRDYAPWNGRHRGCLGVEEGCAPHLIDAPEIVPPALGGGLEVRHLTGAIAWPCGAPVARVEALGDALRVTGEDGTVRELPCDTGFLQL